MSKTDNIILIGPMGAGKTTIGRLLAAELRFSFVDSDHEIEQRCGADISWIFDREGEEGFRDRESVVLTDLLACAGIVLATGGGAIERPANRTLLSQGGIVVYLHTPLAQQYQRTLRDNKRPLLQGGNRRQVLKRLMERREPLYRGVADIVVGTDRRGSRQLVGEILERIDRIRNAVPSR